MKPDDVRIVPLSSDRKPETEAQNLLKRFGSIPPPAGTPDGIRWNALGLKPPAT